MTAFVALGYCALALSVTFKADEKPNWKPDKASEWLTVTLGRTGAGLSAILIIVPFAAIALGYVVASNQENFIVTGLEPRRIVLATYGTDAICAALQSDKDGPWISRSFLLLHLKDEHLGSLSSEEIKSLDVRAPQPAEPSPSLRCAAHARAVPRPTLTRSRPRFLLRSARTRVNASRRLGGR